MTKAEEKEVIRVCGPDYDYEDIPAYIRERDENKNRKSECCGARMIGGIQCESCGSNGKFEEAEDKEAEELRLEELEECEDEKFDFHPCPGEVI